MPSRLILIETSTSLCSTALAEDGKIICSRQSTEPRAHASLTAPFVKQMLDECGWTAADADAVCVGMGPGSYTGLRVGVSTAKGLCFGTGRPLLAVDTLDILAHQALDLGLVPENCAGILPMVDARRMEVYTAPFSPAGERLGEISSVVLEPGSVADVFTAGPVVVIGDAAEKASGVLPLACIAGACVSPHICLQGKLLLKEVHNYLWDEKARQRGEEKPLKENDHAMDALRYLCHTRTNRFRR